VITVSVGISGSGKTHGMDREIRAACRSFPIIIINAMKEFQTMARGVKAASCTQAATVDRLLRQGYRIIRWDVDDPKSALDEACRIAMAHPGHVGVVCSEAHIAIPNRGSVPLYTMKAITQYRHWHVSMWLDTQRLSLINRTVTEQCQRLKLYAMVGNLDLGIVAASWDHDQGNKYPQCSSLVQVCAERLGRGEPGWHVFLGVPRMPPYRLVRG
jgi:hypothetical protein